LLDDFTLLKINDLIVRFGHDVFKIGAELIKQQRQKEKLSQAA